MYKKYFDISKIKEKVLLVNVKNTHPKVYNCKKFEIIPYEQDKLLQIKGATQCCWLANTERVSNCDYVFAVLENEVCGVYKLVGDKCIPVEEVQDKIDILKSKNQFVNFPPYREVEMMAHKYARNTDNVENAREETKKHLSLKMLEIADIALDDIPLKEIGDLSKWDKRKFLILEQCDDNFVKKYNGKILTRNGKNFQFYGAVEYLPKEK